MVSRSPWFLALARPYVRRRIARGLDGLFVAGLEGARAVSRRAPVLFAANHVGWWDSFLVVALDEALGTEAYALMDAAGVARLPFFARLGALPLDRKAPRSGLRLGASMLTGSGRALWMFPQGRHRPSHLRPLGFEPGVSLLARLVPKAAIVPVALQYVWSDQPAPAAYVHFGPAMAAGDASAAALEAAVGAGLDAIDASVSGRAAPFDTLVPGRTKSPERGIGARLLGGRERADG